VVAAIFNPSVKNASWLIRTTLVLGAVFLTFTCYLLLKNVVSGGNGAEGTAEHLTLEAVQRLSPGERADAENEKRSAFAANPLDAAAILDLSIFAAAGGNSEASERLRLSAGDMTPRDTRIQAEALTILLQRGDFGQAMSRIDGLIRARPKESANFFALVEQISADPEGSRAVARLLSSNPPWRSQFFASLLAQGKPATASRLIDGMQAIGAAAADTELASLINAYLKAGNVDQAYATWLSSLSEEELADVKRVYDGGFSHPIRNLRFDWTIKPSEGFTYRLFPRNTASMDQSLQFDFADFEGTFANLSQILRLRPGRYNLKGEVRSEEFETPTGMVFRLYCLEDGTLRALDATAPLPMSSQWLGFDKTFQVPDSGCSSQLLQLESAHALEKDQKTHGLLGIDAIAIDNIEALAQ
jgi:hypothetical protein